MHLCVACMTSLSGFFLDTCQLHSCTFSPLYYFDGSLHKGLAIPWSPPRCYPSSSDVAAPSFMFLFLLLCCSSSFYVATSTLMLPFLHWYCHSFFDVPATHQKKQNADLGFDWYHWFVPASHPALPSRGWSGLSAPFKSKGGKFKIWKAWGFLRLWPLFDL